MNLLKKSNLLKRLRSNKKGFTLVELIVVVVIILILAAVLVPNVLRYVGQAQRVTVKQDAATILTQVQADLAVISSLDAQTSGTALLTKDASGAYTGTIDGVAIRSVAAADFAVPTTKSAVFVVDSYGRVTLFGYSNGSLSISWSSETGWTQSE